MKKLFAIPTVGKKLCAHFGHCEEFAIVETEDKQILQVHYHKPPDHQPGSYPRFLSGLGVSAIISGGMGIKAQEIFAQNNIEVFTGIHSEIPEKLVEQYLNENLQSGTNLCDH
ncbi:MAG: NifB/NifX family molybdenum-iron cluster-binding protein [Bacteroidales bacterium]|nr:NifB/NifX family molybdenum-iron cluster-binding protein [Bacteroidales bacterium]